MEWIITHMESARCPQCPTVARIFHSGRLPRPSFRLPYSLLWPLFPNLAPLFSRLAPLFSRPVLLFSYPVCLFSCSPKILPCTVQVMPQYCKAYRRLLNTCRYCTVCLQYMHKPAMPCRNVRLFHALPCYPKIVFHSLQDNVVCENPSRWACTG